MTKQTRAYLKIQYETGKYPQQVDYEDWLDSYVHLDDFIIAATRTVTITDSNRTDPLALIEGEYTILIILDPALTGDWVPSEITGMEAYKDYKIFIEKLSSNGIDLSGLARIYYNDGVDPFSGLSGLAVGQMAVLPACGLKHGLQLGDLILPDDRYEPPVFADVFSDVFNK